MDTDKFKTSMDRIVESLEGDTPSTDIYADPLQRIATALEGDTPNQDIHANPLDRIATVLENGGGGSSVEGTINIDQNGTYDVAQYAEANVDVPVTGDIKGGLYVANTLTGITKTQILALNVLTENGSGFPEGTNQGVTPFIDIVHNTFTIKNVNQKMVYMPTGTMSTSIFTNDYYHRTMSCVHGLFLVGLTGTASVVKNATLVLTRGEGTFIPIRVPDLDSLSYGTAWVCYIDAKSETTNLLVSVVAATQ